MNFINKIYIGLSLVFGVGISSCGEGTEILTPGEPFMNFFEVDPSDNSADARMRRDFKENTGIYLIFSDVLATYTDDAGVEREERIDFNWTSNTGYAGIEYEYDLLTDQGDKAVSIALLEKYFIPYINVENGMFKPYSVLPVKNLLKPNRYGYLVKSDYISNWNCIAINVEDWIPADEDEAVELGKYLLKSLVNSQLSDTYPELDPFFSICSEAYDAYYISELIPEWVDERNVEWIHEMGFMRYSEDWWGEAEYDSFMTKKNDLTDFMDAVFDEDEEDFREQWGDYPNIILKYEILKECIESIGVDFNGVRL